MNRPRLRVLGPVVRHCNCGKQHQHVPGVQVEERRGAGSESGLRAPASSTHRRSRRSGTAQRHPSRRSSHSNQSPRLHATAGQPTDPGSCAMLRGSGHGHRDQRSGISAFGHELDEPVEVVVVPTRPAASRHPGSPKLLDRHRPRTPTSRPPTRPPTRSDRKAGRSACYPAGARSTWRFPTTASAGSTTSARAVASPANRSALASLATSR